jgi:thiol:disulfide interchange protein
MNSLIRLVLLAGVVTAFLLNVASLPLAGAQKGAKNSAAVVKATVKADKLDAGGKQKLTITLDIDKDWHLYANPVGLKDLEDSQTTVSITSKTKLEDVKIEYPAGKIHKDEVVGDYAVYEGKVMIQATVQRAKGDAGPLQVNIKLQACSDVFKTCLVPATVKKTVE